MSEKRKRINVYLSPKMHEDLVAMADELGLNMSAVMVLAFYNFHQQSTVIPQLEMLRKHVEID